MGAGAAKVQPSRVAARATEQIPLSNDAYRRGSGKNDCVLLERVLRAPCAKVDSERLSRARGRLLRLGRAEVRVDWCALNAAMVRIAEEVGGVCFGGRVRLHCRGADYPRINVERADWNVRRMEARECAQSRLVLVPLCITWSGISPASIAASKGAENAWPAERRRAAVLLLDAQAGEVELFDPLGVDAPWEPTLRAYLCEAVAVHFRGFRLAGFAHRSVAAEADGVGGEYASLLYGALRLACPLRIARRELLALATPEAARLAQQWRCFLQSFAREHKLPEASDAFGACLDRLQHAADKAAERQDTTGLGRALLDALDIERLAPYNIGLAHACAERATHRLVVRSSAAAPSRRR